MLIFPLPGSGKQAAVPQSISYMLCLGCLLDGDLREKPSYQVLYQLIHREWRTELTLKTDENGEASFRGYYGIYDVKVGEDSYEIDFSVS